MISVLFKKLYALVSKLEPFYTNICKEFNGFLNSNCFNVLNEFIYYWFKLYII